MKNIQYLNEELWLLQTNLNNKDLIIVTDYITKLNIKNKNFLQDILVNCNVHNKKKLLDLINNFNKNTPNNSGFLLNKFDLESLLKKPYQHPAFLAFQYQGNPQILEKPIVAIIGSRKPTYYGRIQTQYFTEFLSRAGCTILSGGAIGVDTIANTVAHEYGASCAVIGSGMQNLYPNSNIKLFKNMINSKNGLILSEFHSSILPQKWNFPRRNLSIAALADFVLVIEAASTSGTLITANAATDLGVDVGAIPGGINYKNSEGTNALIKNGAFCIQKPQDVLERVIYLHKIKKNV